MHKLFIAISLAVLVTTPAIASDETDVMVPVHQFVDGFNKGDTKTAMAACAEQMSIIDEFPPYEWHGAGAGSNWVKDYEADAKKNEITDGSVAIDTPRHIDVQGDRAYAVVPASYTFKLKGKEMKESGSMFTFALQKGATGWRITGWAWTKN